MELTIIETSAYQELRKLVSTLAVQMSDLQKKIAPACTGQVNGCAGRMSGSGHIETVPAKLPG